MSHKCDRYLSATGRQNKLNANIVPRSYTTNNLKPIPLLIQEYILQNQNLMYIKTMLLASIAVVSLVVGGIGIMNIMLVSVVERTREIGIRKALGATPYNIMSQFIIEAIVLSLIGGIIGIILGVIVTRIIAGVAGWITVITLQSIILAFFFSVSVGVFFGFYPSKKASDLKPIDALRYE
jgi:putative ABC transport system permease protein